MKSRMLLMGLVLSPWLAFPAQAEEPPDDTIVQETVARLEARGFERMTQPVGPLPPGTVYAGELLEKGAWIRSERLSRGAVEVYEVNREMLGLSNFSSAPRDPRHQGGGTLAGGSSLIGIDSDFGGLASIAEYIEVVEVDIGGQKVSYGRAIPPDEVARRKLDPAAVDYAEVARVQAAGSLAVGSLLQGALADSPFASLMTPNVVGARTTADLLDTGLASCPELLDARRSLEMQLTGLPEVEIEPWTSINPMTFMTGQACFLLAGADAIDALGSIPPESARQIATAIEEARRAFIYQGTQTVDGRPTHKITVEDAGGQLASLGQQAPSGPPDATSPRVEVKAMHVWIDADYYVPRKLRMEGVMYAEGQSRDFFLEKLEQDYRNVPNSTLYEPYRTVLRMGGMLTPSQEAEMRKSQGKLEELERRMASMPASERAMMQRMMGDKIEQWRSLANGGVVEFEIITTSIVVNPDFSASGVSIMPPKEPTPPASTALSPDELRAAQLACLQERAAAAQAAEKKKRGLGRLASAMTRTAALLGDSSIGRVTGDLFSAGQSADDLVAAARDLGLTEDDAAACQQP